jgi:hypothetical protein
VIDTSACYDPDGRGRDGTGAPPTSTQIACEAYIEAYVACYEAAGTDASSLGFDPDTHCDVYLIEAEEVTGFMQCLAELYDGADCSGAIDFGACSEWIEGDGGGGPPTSTQIACEAYVEAVVACYEAAGLDASTSGIDVDTFCDAHTEDVPGASNYLECLTETYASGDCSGAIDTGMCVFEVGGGGPPNSTQIACEAYIGAMIACFEAAEMDTSGLGVDSGACTLYSLEDQSTTDYLLCLAEAYEGGDCTEVVDTVECSF